jgi:CRISPR/Cas system-associated exonuclease Cas4 (RecB family)
MSEIETILANFQMQIKRELHDLVDKTQKEIPSIVHNHPPVQYLVKNCPYCTKFGNCFHKN